MLISIYSLFEKYELKISGVYHVGAHYGQEDTEYARLGIDNVFWFEPQKRVFDILQQRVRGRCFHTALSNVPGVLEMYTETANQGMSSSLLKPGIHMRQYPHIVFNGSETVQVETLDRIVEEHHLSGNFLCMDVQGAELMVLQGARDTMKEIDYVYAEVNRAEVYQDCAMVEQLDEFLTSYGLERVETSWEGGTWGDAFYIKSSLKK